MKNLRTLMTEPSDPATFVVGLLLVLLSLVLALLISSMPPLLTLVVRLIAALGAGMVGAAVPGFWKVQWTGRGAFVRGAFALFLFCIVFLVNPPRALSVLAHPAAPASAQAAP